MTDARMRAADADRQLAAERLAQHFTAGRIDTSEYDDRVRQAYAVTYLDEFPRLFADLPEGLVGPGYYPTLPAAQDFWTTGRLGRSGPGRQGVRRPGPFGDGGPFGGSLNGRRNRILMALGVLMIAMSIVALAHGIVPIPLIILIVVLLVRRGPGRGLRHWPDRAAYHRSR
ncbi:MAG: DUF1707 domain-containing protein [Actinomycetota bacterium]|nr:DUF1707 domain-containing protein [Actinomycetota bacterium]